MSIKEEAIKANQFLKENISESNLKTFQRNPHIFLLGAVMDFQIPWETAWRIPYTVCADLNIELSDFSSLYQVDKASFTRLFLEKKYHRFNIKAAENFYEAIHLIGNKYDGETQKIWEGSLSSADIILRMLEFKGVGIKIASMVANILHREYGILFTDYSAIDISPDVHARRVMYRLGKVDDMDDPNQTLYAAKAMNPSYPGIIDYLFWAIGERKTCMNNLCRKNECPIHLYCIKRGLNPSEISSKVRKDIPW